MQPIAASCGSSVDKKTNPLVHGDLTRRTSTVHLKNKLTREVGKNSNNATSHEQKTRRRQPLRSFADPLVLGCFYHPPCSNEESHSAEEVADKFK